MYPGNIFVFIKPYQSYSLIISQLQKEKINQNGFEEKYLKKQFCSRPGYRTQIYRRATL